MLYTYFKGVAGARLTLPDCVMHACLRVGTRSLLPISRRGARRPGVT